jgi:hypothetical protein
MVVHPYNYSYLGKDKRIKVLGGGVLAVLGLELRAFTLSHSASPIFVKGFLR